FRRRHRAQSVQVLLAPGGLDPLQQLFKLLVVGRPDVKRRLICGTAAEHTAARRSAGAAHCAAGEDAGAAGHRGLPASEEPPEEESTEHHKQEDLEKESQEPAEAKPAAPEPVPEQQPADSRTNQ